MKDNRPSRKESKAQDNIREYLQDIAMGYTTHFWPSTVGMWRSRYKDFRKSEKQAWRDYEIFFNNCETVKREQLKFEGCFGDGPTVNEVEAPLMCDTTTIEKYDRSITVPTEIADAIHHRDDIDNKVAGRAFAVTAIIFAALWWAGHYLYTLAR